MQEDEAQRFHKTKPGDMTYTCEVCLNTFAKLSQLQKHRRTENHWPNYGCPSCKKNFTRKDNLDLHLKKHHNENNHHCPDCLRVFTRRESLNSHFSKHHDQAGGGGVKRKSQDVERRMTKRLKKDDDIKQFYTINKIRSQQIRKFKTSSATYKVTFKNIEITENILTHLRKLFSSIFEDVTVGAKSKDLVRITVQSPSLDYPVVIPFLQLPELTADRFLGEIERVLQSNEDFAIDSSLEMEITHVDMPKGGTRKRCKFVNNDKFLIDKRCVLCIQNRDALCCARAIVTAKAKIDNHEKWNSIRVGCEIQKHLAEQLHHDAGVPFQKCGIDEIKKFQQVLTGYQINVISKEHFNGIIFSGPVSDTKIYLYYHDDHYDVITSMSAFFSRSYYCTKCQKGYDHKEDHKCCNICYHCRKTHDKTEADWLQCDTCHQHFRGQECFDLHQKSTAKGNSTCKTIYRCAECGKTVNRKLDKHHQCGRIYCHTCKEFHHEGHQCYMMPEEKKFHESMSIDEEMISEIENAKTFIFFDFECTQNDLVQCYQGYNPTGDNEICQNCCKSICGSYEHKPNLCVAQKVCTACMDKTTVCENCMEREYVFKGDNTVDNFCKWLFSEVNYDSTVLCHNFQGYDSYPILHFLHKNAILPNVIPNGAKIMCLSVPSCKIKMIDSINFLPMALAKLPKMFGLTELRKGYFPHLFNKKENQTVVLDRLLNISYYYPDSIKPEDRQKFMNWFKNHENDRFDFQEELLSYCRSDVDILRRCCLKFREDFMEITDLDPFEKSITIASACNLVFRSNFL